MWTSTRGRHEIHTALLTQLVQWVNDLPDLKLKFDYNYDCTLFNCTISNLYYTNLCRRKIFTCYSVQRRNSGKNDANFFAWEEDRMTSADSNFNFLCGRPHGAWPPSPVHMRPPEPLPLRVDVINGWPLW